eukprot:gene2309-8600_t
MDWDAPVDASHTTPMSRMRRFAHSTIMWQTGYLRVRKGGSYVCACGSFSSDQAGFDPEVGEEARKSYNWPVFINDLLNPHMRVSVRDLKPHAPTSENLDDLRCDTWLRLKGMGVRAGAPLLINLDAMEVAQVINGNVDRVMYTLRSNKTPAEEHTVAAVRDMFVEGMYFWPRGKKPQQMTAFDYKRWVRMGGIVQVNAILQASRLRE